MKKWFSILTGDTDSTPADIVSEIESLKTERAEVQALADIAAENLSNARMAVLGGDGKQSDVNALDKEITGHKNQVATLSMAITSLEGKLAEAEARERQAQIDAIDRQIEDLRQFYKKIRPEYIRTKLMIEAYEQLLTAPSCGFFQPATDNLWLTGNERKEHGAGIKEKICKGHGSISSEIMALTEKKKKLIKND
ncbi:MAG: hypothetical protein PHG14_06655 [Desulfobacter postgatei]|uniref:hypothetical protein n=1 Tax=Desulfobacter postgatei TaxID=2293 RepID=UPI0023F3110D|nr:hypothetical protein [Desulfobacter postgatei]MDD4273391.1 hypothetical protein [Desulfobacter postgatei]